MVVHAPTRSRSSSRFMKGQFSQPKVRNCCCDLMMEQEMQARWRPGAFSLGTTLSAVPSDWAARPRAMVCCGRERRARVARWFGASGGSAR